MFSTLCLRVLNLVYNFEIAKSSRKRIVYSLFIIAQLQVGNASKFLAKNLLCYKLGDSLFK